MIRVPNGWADPRLAATYDIENDGRLDTQYYLALARRLEARDIADVGSGTGVLAIALAEAGFVTTGLEPSRAMLAIAKARSAVEGVRWLEGTAAHLPDAAFDLVLMAGHVAQVFITDAHRAATLADCRRALRPGGYLAFETADPRAEPWQRWTATQTRRDHAPPDGMPFASWVEVTDLAGDVVSFDATFAGRTGPSLLRLIDFVFARRTPSSVRFATPGSRSSQSSGAGTVDPWTARPPS